MSKVVNLREMDDVRDVIHQAVHVLAEGDLVAFPTETVYVVAAHSLQSRAVDKLHNLFGQSSSLPSTLALKGVAEALDYASDMPPVGRKFARRCWPGPVIIAFDVCAQQMGLFPALPEITRDSIAPDGLLRLRVPAHGILQEVLRLMPAPLVLGSERSMDSDVLRSSQGIVKQCGDQLALVIDDGNCRYGKPSTVVQVKSDNWEVIESGGVTETTLRRLASEVYLFVCTGNTCRSPMAEALFRKLLAEKLQCSEEDLVERGHVVLSAGLAAVVGATPSSEAVEVLSQLDVDIRGHESQPVTSRLIDQADHIYAMTGNHQRALLADRPDVADRVELLSRDGTDISDPIGFGIQEYERCRADIERHLRDLLMEFPNNAGRTELS